MKMTMKEFSEMTGVPLSTVRYYCDNTKSGGALFPLKGDNPKHGNHRRFGNEELDRMEQILIYRKLGLSIQEIRNKFNDPQYDRHMGLIEAIEALNERIRHLKHLELLANAALSLGTTFYSWGALDDDAIDQVGESVERNPIYMAMLEKQREMGREGAARAVESALDLAPEFVAVMDEDVHDEESGLMMLEHANSVAERFFEAMDGLIAPRTTASLYECFLMFAGNGVMQAVFDDRHGAGSAAEISKVFFLLWVVEASKVFDPLVLRFIAHDDAEGILGELKTAIIECLTFQRPADPIEEFDERPEEYLYLAENRFVALGAMRERNDEELRAYLGLDPRIEIVGNAYDEAISALWAEAGNPKGELSS